MFNVLVVDDQPPIVNAMRRVINQIPAGWLHQQACNVTGFSDPAEALQSLNEKPYDVVVADLAMPGMGGMEFLRKAQQLQPDATRIIVSGHGSFPTALAAINETQVFRFVPKPWNDKELQLALTQALLTAELQRENQQLADSVRADTNHADAQASSLRKLEAEYPGITRVDWDDSGAICIDEDAP